MDELLLKIEVVLDRTYNVLGKNGEVTMILFHGECTGKYFTGTVQAGGVDTQIQEQGELKKLSARYILEGKDFNGLPCRIFIENNGIVSEKNDIMTYPVIYTDSPALQWMEEESLIGRVKGKGESLVEIHIYKERKNGCRN